MGPGLAQTPRLTRVDSRERVDLHVKGFRVLLLSFVALLAVAVVGRAGTGKPEKVEFNAADQAAARAAPVRTKRDRSTV